jgi:AcrR family transcriptional regulator
MAAVGYHYGSLEALLNTALLQAIDEWGAEFGRALATGSDPDADSARRYESMLARAIESFTEHHQMGLASLDAVLQAQHSPELRGQLAAGQREGRRGMAAMLQGIEENDVTDTAARALGSVQLALITGLMMQYLTDPENAASSTDVMDGLRAIAEIISPD